MTMNASLITRYIQLSDPAKIAAISALNAADRPILADLSDDDGGKAGEDYALPGYQLIRHFFRAFV